MKQVRRILLLLLVLGLSLGLAAAASADAVERYGFTLNDTWFEITETGEVTGLPEGVTFTVGQDACTLTLTNASLTGQLDFDYQGLKEDGTVDYQNLPYDTLWIKLVGQNAITTTGTSALGIHGGLKAVVVSESNGSLTLAATNEASKQQNDNGVYTVSALDLWGATKFSVLSGSVTAKVDGEVTVSWEEDGETKTEMADLCAVNGDGGVNLALSGGSLTLEGDQGIGQVGVLSVYDGTLTMPGGFMNCVYMQEGGTVNVTGVRTYEATSENEMDYWVGLNFYQKALNLSGGTLNIKVENERAESGYAVWGSGLSVNGGRVNISGGTLTIEVASGEGVSLSSAFWNQTGGHVIVKNSNTEDPVGVSIGGYSEDRLDWSEYRISGGTLNIQGKLDVMGKLSVKEGGEVSVGPYYSNAAQRLCGPSAQRPVHGRGNGR